MGGLIGYHLRIEDHCYRTSGSASALGSQWATMSVSPTLSFLLLAQFMTMHPAEHPAAGGCESSAVVQHWQPWMKKALRPHISLGFWGSRQKAQGLCVVSCITLTQQPSLQVVAGRGPVFTTHSQSGLRQPLPCPLQVRVLIAYSPMPPRNRPVFWQKQQVMAGREASDLQQSVVQEALAYRADPRTKGLQLAMLSNSSAATSVGNLDCILFVRIYYQLLAPNLNLVLEILILETIFRG